MRIREPRFEIHRAQKTAAALLLVFVLQSLWLTEHLPLNLAETRSVLAGKSLWSSRAPLSHASPLIPGDSVLTLRCAGLLPSLGRHFETSEFSIYGAPNRWLVRLPFVLFGLWLGAALWWVARRLFSDLGGYVALALYCFSPPILMASSTVNSAILTAWGLFGLVFTAIGVAHILDAPTKKWQPRILLLGIAIGLTAAANTDAAIAGLVFAAAFMLYLAPHRRLLAIIVLAASSVVGVLVFMSCFAFNLRDLKAAAVFNNSQVLSLTTGRVYAFPAVPGGLLEIFALSACVLIFLFWKRTRYFGNTAPLIVALALPWWPGRFASGASMIWTLPFIFVFCGGVYADLLEPQFFSGRFRKLVASTAIALAGASLLLAAVVLAAV